MLIQLGGLGKSDLDAFARKGLHMGNHVFISHTTKDDEFIKALRVGLERQGLKAYVDSRDLAPGNELVPEIGRAIDEARAFILVLSQNSINSPWVLEETKHAIRTGTPPKVDRHSLTTAGGYSPGRP